MDIRLGSPTRGDFVLIVLNLDFVSSSSNELVTSGTDFSYELLRMTRFTLFGPFAFLTCAKLICFLGTLEFVHISCLGFLPR